MLFTNGRSLWKQIVSKNKNIITFDVQTQIMASQISVSNNV